MNIEKDGKIYTVRENQKSWTVTLTDGRVTISAKVQKADCPTFDDLKAFIAENNLF